MQYITQCCQNDLPLYFNFSFNKSTFKLNLKQNVFSRILFPYIMQKSYGNFVFYILYLTKNAALLFPYYVFLSQYLSLRLYSSWRKCSSPHFSHTCTRAEGNLAIKRNSQTYEAFYIGCHQIIRVFFVLGIEICHWMSGGGQG